MLGRVQERLGHELERALRHSDELAEEVDDLVSASIIAGVVLLAGLVPADLLGEERAGGVPITSGTRVVELADGSFLRIH